MQASAACAFSRCHIVAITVQANEYQASLAFGETYMQRVTADARTQWSVYVPCCGIEYQVLKCDD